MSKKRKYDDPLAAPEGLQKHWAFHGARLTRKEVYRSQDIFLGDGGPHFDAKYSKQLEKDDEWMKKGYYVSVFAIQIGKAFFGNACYFKIDHDLDCDEPSRSKKRVEAALTAAKRIIDDGIDMVHPPIFQEYKLIIAPKRKILTLH